MIIGIDFDNTIVCYNDVFLQAAIEFGLISQDTAEQIPPTKKGIKGYLIADGREQDWTRLQGIVYGSAIHLAKPFEGVKVWIQSQREQRNRVYIVSHRTRYPILGEKIDLHLAARNWIYNQKIEVDGAFFFESRADKINKIGELKCDIFFDDLKEVLEDEYFPVNTKKVLFYPDSVNSEKIEGFLIHSHWGDCDFRF